MPFENWFMFLRTSIRIKSSDFSCRPISYLISRNAPSKMDSPDDTCPATDTSQRLGNVSLFEPRFCNNREGAEV